MTVTQQKGWQVERTLKMHRQARTDHWEACQTQQRHGPRARQGRPRHRWPPSGQGEEELSFLEAKGEQ